MGEMQTLGARQMLSGSEQLRHVLEQRAVVRRAPLVGRPSLKQDRVPALALQVKDGSVADSPVCGGERRALHGHSERDAAQAAALAAHIRPQGQVVDKLE